MTSAVTSAVTSAGTSTSVGARSLGFHFITVFPEMIEQALGYGVVSQAMKSGLLTLTTVSPRIFTSNVHQTIDDRPFGGGDGMIMMAEPLTAAVNHVHAKIAPVRRTRVIHLSPRGRKFSDQVARELSHYDDLILVASRYGGVDQRFLNDHVDEEISIGDFVLSGGELAGLVLIDAVARLLPGVLGNDQSANTESFGPELNGALEFPQFTRPREWNGTGVPDALMSGDHARIKLWKNALAILVTAMARPELLEAIPRRELELALKYLKTAAPDELKLCGLEAAATLEKTLTELLAHPRNLK